MHRGDPGPDARPMLASAPDVMTDPGDMPSDSEWLRLRLLGLLFAMDVALILSGFVIGIWLRFERVLEPQGLAMIEVILPIYLVVAANGGAYSHRALLNRRFSVSRALTSLAAAAIAIVFIGFYLRANADFSRLAFSFSLALSALAVVIGRVLFHSITRRMFGHTLVSTVLILDGATANAGPAAVVLDARAAGLVPDVNDPLMLDRLGRFLKRADRVVVACSEDRRTNWAIALKGANIVGEIVDPEIERLGALGTGQFGTEGTLVVSAGALGLRGRIVKRLLDLGLSVVVTIFAAPILVATAIAIKLDDGGPVLFVQQRLGRGNTLFNMYKFRSMKVDLLDRAGNRSTGRDDDRITRVGSVIRKLSIDELPQLLNVLRGDMSFVGPRPHALGSLAGDQLFWEVDQRYWHRHASKPGLTGLAQVRGFRGATLERVDLVNRLQADLEYLSNWTIGRDLKILIATLKVIVHRNAF